MRDLPEAKMVPQALRIAALTIVACFAAMAAEPDDVAPLPRKVATAGHTDELYPGVTVLYDTLRDATGHRLRMIATYPDRMQGRFPVIFVVGWLSCDTVEAPPGTSDATQLMLQAAVKIPGFATVRLEKAGVGDSEGDCVSTDFAAELDAYRRAFRHTTEYSFVDPSRIFLFGISNGGGFAPLVAEGAPVKGYVVDGGWIKTWYEHMLEIERRRLVLQGHPPSEINRLMKSVEHLYSEYLLKRRSPRDIFAEQPELQMFWDGPVEQQYGRPIVYYQQLQDLDLMAAWSAIRVPVLALRGEFDWIMSRSDFEMLVGLVNNNAPGAAEFVELPHTGHTFEHYESLQAAFAGRALPFDQRIAKRVSDWFAHHR
jgi:pimeloyl-ACP methyl ester carboxylesterase